MIVTCDPEGHHLRGLHKRIVGEGAHPHKKFICKITRPLQGIRGAYSASRAACLGDTEMLEAPGSAGLPGKLMMACQQDVSTLMRHRTQMMCHKWMHEQMVGSGGQAAARCNRCMWHMNVPGTSIMKTPRESRESQECSAPAFGTMNRGAASDCGARREMKHRFTPNLRRFCHCRSSNLHKGSACESGTWLHVQNCAYGMLNFWLASRHNLVS